jgi:hypothetical protein
MTGVRSAPQVTADDEEAFVIGAYLLLPEVSTDEQATA